MRAFLFTFVLLFSLVAGQTAYPSKNPTPSPTRNPTTAESVTPYPTPTPRGMYENGGGPEPTPSPPAPTAAPTPSPTIIDRNPTSFATMKECEVSMRNRWLAANKQWNWCRQHGEAHFLRVRCSCACLVNSQCRRRLGETEPDWLLKIPQHER